EGGGGGGGGRVRRGGGGGGWRGGSGALYGPRPGGDRHEPAELRAENSLRHLYRQHAGEGVGRSHQSRVHAAIFFRLQRRTRAEGRRHVRAAHAGRRGQCAGQGDGVGSATKTVGDLARRTERGDAQAARGSPHLRGRGAGRRRAPHHDGGAPVGRARRNPVRRPPGLASHPVEPQEPAGDRQAAHGQGRAAEGNAGGSQTRGFVAWVE